MAIGVGFVCVLYMWVEDLISTGNVVRMPETQELFVLALIYDVMTRCYGKFAHLWAFMSYLLITLAGIISMVSWPWKSITINFSFEIRFILNLIGKIIYFEFCSELSDIINIYIIEGVLLPLIILN